MIAKPIAGALPLEIPGYPRSLNLTRKGYIPSTSGVNEPILLNLLLHNLLNLQKP